MSRVCLFGLVFSVDWTGVPCKLVAAEAAAAVLIAAAKRLCYSIIFIGHCFVFRFYGLLILLLVFGESYNFYISHECFRLSGAPSTLAAAKARCRTSSGERRGQTWPPTEVLPHGAPKSASSHILLVIIFLFFLSFIRPLRAL